MADTVFTPWQALGYTPLLLPIARAGARLSPYSNLTPDKLGKTPTHPTEDGWIGGVDWTAWEVTAEVVAEWCTLLGKEACNVGLNAKIIHGLDVDTDDPEFAKLVAGCAEPLMAEAQLGVRVGRPPGFLVPFRVATPRHKARIVVVHTGTGARSAVELLGVGQQYVVTGIHPKTGQPYRWYATFGRTLQNTPLADCRIVADAVFDAVWSSIGVALQDTPYALVSARALKPNGSPAPAPGENLAPDQSRVAEALRWLPNDPGRNRSRESWVAIAFAVAGATGKSQEGWELFERWSLDWRDDIGHAENTARLWQSINPEHCHIGYTWLAHQAALESAGRCTLAAEDAFSDDLENLDRPVPTDDGAFADPVQTRPSRAEVDTMIAGLTAESGADQINAVLALMVRHQPDVMNTEELLHTIKTATGKPIRALRSAYGRAAAKAALDGIDDVGQRLARLTLAKIGQGKLAYREGQWYRYAPPVWSPVDYYAVAQVTLSLIDTDKSVLQRPGNPMPLRVHQAIYEAMGILQAMVSQRLAKLDDPAAAVRPAINLRNCTLWINNETGEVTQRRHDPDDCFLWYTDIDYDPSAACPRYDAVLAEILSHTAHTVTRDDPEYDALMQRVRNSEATENKPVILADGRRTWRTWLAGRQLRIADVADNVRLVNEMLGYILTPWRGARVFMIIKGNGSNGKSQLIEALANAIPGAVANKPIESFDQPFGYVEVRNKLLLWDDDLAKRTLISDSAAKKLSENKMLTVPKKNCPDVTFINTAVPVILSNNWPLTNDISQGMTDRALVLEVGHKYKPEDRAKNPWPAIAVDRREMSGMFNRWLAGAVAVIKRKQILPSKAAIEAHTRWVRRSVPEKIFLDEVCQQTPPEGAKSEGESLEDLHSAYHSWYAVNIGGNPRWMRGRNQFSEAMEQLGFTSYLANGRVRFRGLWLRPEKVSREFGVSYVGPSLDADVEL